MSTTEPLAQLTPEERIYRTLKRNWYRLNRYDNAEQADTAIFNVAGEIKRELFG